MALEDNTPAPDVDLDAGGDDDAGDTVETTLEDDVSAAFDRLAAGEDINSETPASEGDSTQDAAPAPEQATDAGQTDDSSDVDSTQGAETPPEQADVSAYWSDGTRAKFDALDPKSQEFVKDVIKDQTADYTRKSQELAAAQQDAQQVHQAIAPYMQNIQASGVTPEVAVQALLATENVLRHGTPEQKAQQLQALAEQYDVQLPSSNLDDLDIDDFDDPTVAPLKREIENLRSQLGNATQQLQGFQNQFQQQQAKQFEDAQSQAQAFMDAKNEDGSPKHPYVEQVAPQMRSYLQTGDHTLEQAYQMAVQANPALAKKIADEAAARETASKAAAARKAVGDPRSQVKQPRDENTGRYTSPDTVEQAASDAYDQLASGG